MPSTALFPSRTPSLLCALGQCYPPPPLCTGTMLPSLRLWAACITGSSECIIHKVGHAWQGQGLSAKRGMHQGVHVERGTHMAGMIESRCTLADTKSAGHTSLELWMGAHVWRAAEMLPTLMPSPQKIDKPRYCETLSQARLKQHFVVCHLSVMMAAFWALPYTIFFICAKRH